MYASVHAWVCLLWLHVCIHTWGCVHVSVSVCARACMSIGVHVHRCACDVCLNKYAHTCISMYVCTHAWMCIPRCMCLHTWVCTHMCTHTCVCTHVCMYTLMSLWQSASPRDTSALSPGRGLTAGQSLSWGRAGGQWTAPWGGGRGCPLTPPPPPSSPPPSPHGPACTTSGRGSREDGNREVCHYVVISHILHSNKLKVLDINFWNWKFHLKNGKIDTEITIIQFFLFKILH